MLVITPGRPQSKTISIIDNRGSKIYRNRPSSIAIWQQMAIESSVSNNFLSTFLDSIGEFDCCLPGMVIEGGLTEACMVIKEK